ncbi:hypothetical protein [Metabacillus fastidiosus]|uniref:hypothetical protein n=1 Tax=Metabacillus fastidiosus TaxID=1458 RepID=UPI003D2A048B
MEWYWYLLIGWVICYGLALALTINTERKKKEEKNSKIMIVIISFVLSFIVLPIYIYLIGTGVKSLYERKKYGGHITDRH